MKNIIFIADFFLEQGVNGGAEICNDQLINMFLSDGHKVMKINSQKVTPTIIETNSNNSFFIVANFMTLSEHCKKALKNVSRLKKCKKFH